MGIDDIIETIENNELKRPLRAGLEKQTVINELKGVVSENSSPDREKITKVLVNRLSKDDASSLEKLL